MGDSNWQRVVLFKQVNDQVVRIGERYATMDEINQAAALGDDIAPSIVMLQKGVAATTGVLVEDPSDKTSIKLYIVALADSDFFIPGLGPRDCYCVALVGLELYYLDAKDMLMVSFKMSITLILFEKLKPRG